MEFEPSGGEVQLTSFRDAARPVLQPTFRSVGLQSGPEASGSDRVYHP